MIKSASIALAMSVAGAAAAQKAPPPPAEPKAPVASITYRSAFESYRAFGDVQALPWRKANDEVGSLEGHQGHLQSPKQPADGKASDGGDKGHYK